MFNNKEKSLYNEIYLLKKIEKIIDLFDTYNKFD